MHDWQQQIVLAPYTTLKIGGPADLFVTVTNEEALTTRIAEAVAAGMPYTILGGGSNVLVNDAGVRGAVIQNAIGFIEEVVEGDDVLVTVGAGTLFDELVAFTVTHGYWGLENLSHIPGSVGATPVQNVGAYGVEVADCITSVRVFDTETSTFTTLTNAACKFGYRDSIFKHAAGKRYVVAAVTFRLHTDPTPKLEYKDLAARFATQSPSQMAIREAVIEIRAKKFPDWHQVGTAGSFFKNPIIPQSQYNELVDRYDSLPGFSVGNGMVKVPLGWILEHVCHARGITKGNVGTYQGQALVLINHGGATAAEVTAFANGIIADVYDKTGITVEWEVTKI